MPSKNFVDTWDHAGIIDRMRYRTFDGRLLIPTFTILLLTGCFHQSWSFRAAPNLNIARPNELGSEGPLVLVVADKADAGSPRAASAGILQSAMTDPVFRSKLEQKRQAAEALEKWQSNLGDQHPRVIEARLTLAEATENLDD